LKGNELVQIYISPTFKIEGISGVRHMWLHSITFNFINYYWCLHVMISVVSWLVSMSVFNRYGCQTWLPWKKGTCGYSSNKKIWNFNYIIMVFKFLLMNSKYIFLFISCSVVGKITVW